MKSPRILILGSGIAGLSAALKFARHAPGIQVTLVCKADPIEGSTRYAQGGIASVWSKQDSFEEHKHDTLQAGAGLCNEKIVEICVHEGPERVRELIELGVPFTKLSHPEAHAQTAPSASTGQDLPISSLAVHENSDPAETFSLHREGGHGKRRILHADDLTGLAIENTLFQHVQAQPNVEILANHIAIDLITEGKAFKRWRGPGACLGAYVLDTQTGRILTIGSDITILATGGAGKVYLYTSNPDVSTGDGVAMAFRASACVANLEFMQFHPTCLYHPNAKNFLISEALRGEGAVLRTISGEEFMPRHHMMGSLAPRDIVARAIDIEMKRTGDKHVLLDASPLLKNMSVEQMKGRFPNIHQTCLKYGIDITAEPIPVVPAAHYMCGGVLVNEHAETTIRGLYAIGEVACTGLHGANRLASNSLLEAVVFAHRAFLHASPRLFTNERPATRLPGPLPAWDSGQAVQLEEQIDIAANWLEIRSLMWNYVGIVRSNRRLERARRRIEVLKAEVNQYYWNFLLTKDLIELRNILTVADLTVQCAALRKESRGLHYTVDYPVRDDDYFAHDTII